MRKKIKFIELNLKATTMNIPVTFLYFYMYKYMYIFEKIVKSLSRVRLFPTPWTVVCQAPLSTGIIQAGILEWVAIFFSRRSSQPRDQTLSCIVGRFFTIWATKEALAAEKKYMRREADGHAVLCCPHPLPAFQLLPLLIYVYPLLSTLLPISFRVSSKANHLPPVKWFCLKI